MVPVPVRRAGRSPRRPLATRPGRAGDRRRRLAQRRAPASFGEHVGCAPAPRSTSSRHTTRSCSGSRPSLPLFAQRKPRPRWRSLLLRSQNQRWYRTTLLGRVPRVGAEWGAGGALAPTSPPRLGTEPLVAERSVHATCDGADGVVEIRLRLGGVEAGTEAEFRVGDHRHATTVVDAEGSAVDATIRVPAAERWWPHTHGDQPLYAVGLTLAGERSRPWHRRIPHGGGGPCRRRVHALTQRCSSLLPRGAWVPPDAVTLGSPETALRMSLQLLVDAGHEHGEDRRLHVVRGLRFLGPVRRDWASWCGRTACWRASTRRRSLSSSKVSGPEVRQQLGDHGPPFADAGLREQRDTATGGHVRVAERRLAQPTARRDHSGLGA